MKTLFNFLLDDYEDVIAAILIFGGFVTLIFLLASMGKSHRETYEHNKSLCENHGGTYFVFENGPKCLPMKEIPYK